jgi:hypothetical protein
MAKLRLQQRFGDNACGDVGIQINVCERRDVTGLYLFPSSMNV